MASKVGICNTALTFLGADRITAITDNTENARRLNAIYDQCLEDVLRSHPWNFSITRVALALLATTPAFGYDYEFQLPTNCLRLVEVSDGTNVLTDYKVEGRKILTDYTTIYIKYITVVSDPNQYTSQFIFVLASRLAAELAYAITNNKSTAELAAQVYQARLQTAKETDAQESDSVNIIDQDSWAIDNRI
jgi:hypothetical protein